MTPTGNELCHKLWKRFQIQTKEELNLGGLQTGFENAERILHTLTQPEDLWTVNYCLLWSCVLRDICLPRFWKVNPKIKYFTKYLLLLFGFFIWFGNSFCYYVMAFPPVQCVFVLSVTSSLKCHLDLSVKTTFICFL